MPAKRHLLAVIFFLALCLCAISGYAQGVDTLEFSLGTAFGNPGDTVEVPIFMNAGNTAPATFILWIRYDPAKLTPEENYYQFTQSVPGGGAPEVSTSFVRPESAVVNGDKFVESNIPQPGILVVLVAGGPAETVNDGLVLTLAFSISAGAIDGESFAVEGVNAGDAGSTDVSSAADSAAFPQGIPVLISDGTVQVGCSPASSVTGVSASTERSDGVLISWTGNSESGAQYRVYRNTVNSSATAQPIGEAWQAATTFLDITAAAPTINDPGGCSKPVDFTPFTYFYWVLARTAEGCVSENFSSPTAQGSRTLDPNAKSATIIKESVLPAARASASAMSAQSDSALAIRLDAGDAAIDPATVWGIATGDSWQSEAVTITPANELGAIWVTLKSDAGWTPSEHVTFQAGASSVAGESVGPIVAEYIIANADKSAQSPPILPEGIGEVFDVAPEGAFATPETLMLPIPTGHENDELYLYYYSPGNGWTLAENVDGFLINAEQAVDKGEHYVSVTLRHSGLVQLGLAPFPAAPKQQGASMLATPRSAADLAMFLLVLALLGGMSKGRITSKRIG